MPTRASHRVQASTSGERVPARGGHTCVVADFQLVVFGGTYYKGHVSKQHLPSEDNLLNRILCLATTT